MRKSELVITDTSKTVCRTLFEAEQIVPEDSLFQDDLFDETCEMIQDRNKAKVIQDIARKSESYIKPLLCWPAVF